MDRYIRRELQAPGPPNPPGSPGRAGENTLYLDTGYGGEINYTGQHIKISGPGAVMEYKQRTPTNPLPMNVPRAIPMERPTVQIRESQQSHSGIDPNYLSSYRQNSPYDPSQEMVRQIYSAPTHCVPPPMPQVFGLEYEQRDLMKVERLARHIPRPRVSLGATAGVTTGVPVLFKSRSPTTTSIKDISIQLKEDSETKTKSLVDKEKELQKEGLRVFAGPVGKIIQWHKILQEIGVLCYFEVVAKVVSVRQGMGCAVHVLVRDEGGPVLQIVYYEVDFLMPDLGPHCTVRVVGKMATGAACRLQAYSIRRANGDDVAALPRRTAVASHQLEKMRQICVAVLPKVET